MNDLLQEDLQAFQTLLEETQQEATQFLKTLPQRPAAVTVNETETLPFPARGKGGIETLRLFMQKYQSLLSGSAGARYLGFVTGGATPASVMGDWLTGVFDQNLSNFGDSVAPHIELQTIEWLRQLFHLPDEFQGSFVTGATMSNFTSLAIARQWIARHYTTNSAEEGLYNLPPIKILGGAPHSSIFKAISMLGMGKKNIQQIATLRGREAIDVKALEEALQNHSSSPAIVVANAGTVNTVDFDDLQAIGRLKKKYNFWLHVDAAFGGFAACTPHLHHLWKGVDYADSITIDAHKWLNVPYDSAIQFTRHRALQLEVFQNSASYLGEIGTTPDFVHLTPENSRRFRALPAWFSLMAYGQEGCREIVERSCTMAQLLHQNIENHSSFQLLAPTRVNVVCFTLLLDGRPVDLPTIQQYLNRLKEKGKVFLTQTIYKGTPGIRAAFSNWRTTEEDVKIAWESMKECWNEQP